MQTSLPGLVVDVEARIDKLEKSLAKANKLQARSADQMERRAKQSADKLGATYGTGADKIAASFTRISGAMSKVVPIVGTIAAAGAGAVAALDKVSRGIAETGDMARRAGVDFEAFQRLKFVAEQNRVGVDALTDGLKELQIRADEFALTGKGSGAEAFTRLGFTADQLKRKLEDPSELFLEITGRLEDMDRAAQIRIADEVFGGTGGEQFVQLLAKGEKSLRATAQRAEELGLVLGNDVLERAEAVNRKFDEIKARVAGLGKSIVVNVAGALEDALSVDIDEIFGSAERAISMLGRETYDALKDTPALLEDQRDNVEDLIAVYGDLFTSINAATGPDGVRLLDHADVDAAYDLASILQDIDREMIAFENGKTSAEQFTDEMIELIGEADAVVTQLAAIDGVRFGGVVAAIGSISAALSEAIGRAATLGSTLPGEGPIENLTSGPQNGRRPPVALRPSALAPTSSTRPTLPSVNASFGVPDPEEASGGGGGGGASKPKADDYQREVAAIREMTQELQLERIALVSVAAAGTNLSAAIDAAQMKAQLLAAAFRSGRADSAALRAEVDGLVTSHSQANVAVDGVTDKLDGMQSARDKLTGVAENAFTGLITGTMGWQDALSGVLGSLAEMAASSIFKSIFLGGGAAGGTGLLGGLFGFSDGGYTGPGGKHEPAGVVHKGEFVLSKSATSAIGVPALEQLHKAAQRGYSKGGYVGAAPAFSAPPKLARANAAPSVSIAAPITVHGSSGTPEQNDDLARKMAREMEQSMRQTVENVILRSMRPGGVLNR